MDFGKIFVVVLPHFKYFYYIRIAIKNEAE